MSGDHWREVEEAFMAALDLPGNQRGPYVESLAPDLREGVAALLRGHAEADRMLPVPQMFREPEAGDRVGPYRILRQIGRGGMGTVYEADRSDGQFVQKVAIKVLSVQIVGDEAMTRFRMERQILAMLDHPNIVRLLDGGVTTAGAPYFAMELVSGGQPITEYCISRSLGVADRLRLFEDACSALDYAHRHSVIHRDIKPANVFVNAEGSVKILDFGIAKVLAPIPGTGDVNLTTHLAPMTPGYASPERLRGEGVTTSSDIYSMGLVLGEAIPGARPQDLESIIRKATASDPLERYASPAELGRDIRRYLEGAPVSARQASLSYILAKALRKQWKGVAVTIAAVTLAAGALWWQSHQTTLEKQHRYEQVRSVTSSMLGDIQERIGNLPGSLEARRNMTAQALKYLESLRKEAKGDSGLELDLARAYMQMAGLLGGNSDPNLGEIASAAAMRERARELAESILSREPRNTSASQVLASYYAAVCVDNTYQRKMDPAIAAGERTVAIRREILAREPGNAQLESDVAGALQVFGNAVGLQDQQRKRALFLESLGIIERLLIEKPKSRILLRNAALAAKNLSATYLSGMDYPMALTYARKALELDQQLLESNPKDRVNRLDISFDLSTLSTISSYAGNIPDALHFATRCVKIREDLVAEDPKDVRARDRLTYAHGILAESLLRNKQAAAALVEAETAIRQNEQLLRESPGLQASSVTNLAWYHFLKGSALAEKGSRASACEAFQESVKRYDSIDKSVVFARDTANDARARLSACGGK